MKPLFEISNDYLSLFKSFEDKEELTEEHLLAINQIENDFNEKASNIGLIVKMFTIEYRAIQENIQNQEKRMCKVIKKIEKLKEYLKTEMERVGVDNVKNTEVDIKIKNNPLFVEIKDEAIIPTKYFIEQTQTKIDKAFLSRDLKAGEIIPGAELKQRKRIDIT